MSVDVPHVYSILLSRGYQSQLFSDLQRPKKQGKETIADCPFCQDTGQHFSYSLNTPLWKCWKCGRGGDWIDYLGERRGLDFRAALQELAKDAGVQLAGFNQAAYQAKARKADILEAAHKLFTNDLFFNPHAQAVLDYLLQRGYNTNDIQEMELGAYIDVASLEQELKQQGYTLQEIKDAGLQTGGYGTDYQLMLLWRDQASRAIGLAGRSLLTEAELKLKGIPKYKYSAGLQKDQGLIGFTAARGAKDITLVEGPLDALYINSKQAGIAAVALGGTGLQLGHIQMLEATGTVQATLALDSDAPGQRATNKALDLLSRSRLYTFVATLPAGHKDPDELVRKQGINALIDVLNQATEWPKWRAQYIVSQHSIQTDKGLTEAIYEAMEAYESIEAGHERRYFMEALQQATALPAAELEDRTRKQTEQLSKKRAEARLRDLLNTLHQKAAQGDVLGAEQDMEQGLRRLKQARGITAPEPYLLEDMLHDLRSTTEGLLSGYASLDKLLRIPTGALTIIAGRPGHGKTTLLLNLLVHLLRAYPSLPFYFYSYEEARSRLGLKLLMILAGHVLHPEHNQGEYLSYIKHYQGVTRQEPAIDQAMEQLKEWLDTGHLLLMDKRLPGEDLAAIIGHEAGRGQVGAVLIDYIQKIPLQQPMSQPYLTIKEVSSLLLEQAVSQNIPIILGAQLGRGSGSSKEGGSRVRLDNLREGGDIEQDASLVLGLFNASVDKIEEDGKANTGPIVDLEVSVLKHRAGIAGRKAVLSFQQPTLRILDRDLTGKSLY